MTTTRRAEAGFALVLALLTLMVLTFLGLTLATTTSTELQVGYNYKWNQQAYYNAQAGIELAKRFLRQQTWVVLVPAARMTQAEMASLPSWSLSNSRDFENSDCDTLPEGTRGVGYGVVLHIAGSQPFQNVTSFLGQNLGGAFTVWVRRPLKVQDTTTGPLTAGEVHDDESPSKIVVTAEGVAPFQAATAATSAGQRRQAVRIVEVELEKIDPGDCENDFAGQTGLGALGANYDPCGTVAAAGVPGATAEINPNQ
jgi:Tfp pilus assembly protein PilX